MKKFSQLAEGQIDGKLEKELVALLNLIVGSGKVSQASSPYFCEAPSKILHQPKSEYSIPFALWSLDHGSDFRTKRYPSWRPFTTIGLPILEERESPGECSSQSLSEEISSKVKLLKEKLQEGNGQLGNEIIASILSTESSIRALVDLDLNALSFSKEQKTCVEKLMTEITERYSKLLEEYVSDFCADLESSKFNLHPEIDLVSIRRRCVEIQSGFRSFKLSGMSFEDLVSTLTKSQLTIGCEKWNSERARAQRAEEIVSLLTEMNQACKNACEKIQFKVSKHHSELSIGFQRVCQELCIAARKTLESLSQDDFDRNSQKTFLLETAQAVKMELKTTIDAFQSIITYKVVNVEAYVNLLTKSLLKLIPENTTTPIHHWRHTLQTLASFSSSLLKELQPHLRQTIQDSLSALGSYCHLAILESADGVHNSQELDLEAHRLLKDSLTILREISGKAACQKRIEILVEQLAKSLDGMKNFYWNLEKGKFQGLSLVEFYSHKFSCLQAKIFAKLDLEAAQSEFWSDSERILIPLEALRDLACNYESTHRVIIDDLIKILALQYLNLVNSKTAALKGATFNHNMDQLNRQIHKLFQTSVPIITGKINSPEQIHTCVQEASRLFKVAEMMSKNLKIYKSLPETALVYPASMTFNKKFSKKIEDDCEEFCHRSEELAAPRPVERRGGSDQPVPRLSQNHPTHHSAPLYRMMISAMRSGRVIDEDDGWNQICTQLLYNYLKLRKSEREEEIKIQLHSIINDLALTVESLLGAKLCPESFVDLRTSVPRKTSELVEFMIHKAKARVEDLWLAPEDCESMLTAGPNPSASDLPLNAGFANLFVIMCREFFEEDNIPLTFKVLKSVRLFALIDDLWSAWSLPFQNPHAQILYAGMRELNRTFTFEKGVQNPQVTLEGALMLIELLMELPTTLDVAELANEISKQSIFAPRFNSEGEEIIYDIYADTSASDGADIFRAISGE